MSRATASPNLPRSWYHRLAFVGPGIVVAGSVMGSGELINTPVQAATFGFVLLWAVLLACVIKFFLQVEIARFCLVNNYTTIQALNQVPGPRIRGTSWTGLLYMPLYVISMLPVLGILGALGGLLHGIMPLAGDVSTSTQIWSVLVTLLAMVLLWQGLYRHLETLVAVLVGIFSLSLVAGLLLIQGTEFRITGEEFWSGLTFSLGDHRREAAFAVISLMGGLGVTANELFMYPYWILEKGYAANLKDVPQPEWRERARQWIRAIYLDAGISTLVATAMTAAFFLLGCAILFRRGEQPTGLEVVNQISSVYTEAYGAWSRWLFLIGAFSTLFSTLVVVTAASGRMIGDLLSSMKYIDASQPEKLRRCHQWVQVLWLLGLLIGFLVQKSPPEQLVILGHWIVGAVLTPLLMLSICWLAFHTDRRARMSSLGAVLLVTSTAIIAACVLGGLIVRYVS